MKGSGCILIRVRLERYPVNNSANIRMNTARISLSCEQTNMCYEAPMYSNAHSGQLSLCILHCTPLLQKKKQKKTKHTHTHTLLSLYKLITLWMQKAKFYTSCTTVSVIFCKKSMKPKELKHPWLLINMQVAAPNTYKQLQHSHLWTLIISTKSQRVRHLLAVLVVKVFWAMEEMHSQRTGALAARSAITQSVSSLVFKTGKITYCILPPNA